MGWFVKGQAGWWMVAGHPCRVCVGGICGIEEVWSVTMREVEGIG